jgi:hypothetical protein
MSLPWYDDRRSGSIAVVKRVLPCGAREEVSDSFVRRGYRGQALGPLSAAPGPGVLVRRRLQVANHALRRLGGVLRTPMAMDECHCLCLVGQLLWMEWALYVNQCCIATGDLTPGLNACMVCDHSGAFQMGRTYPHSSS